MKITITTSTKTIRYTYNLKKRSNQITSRGVFGNKGVCRVAYRTDEVNEFEFEDEKDFQRKFLPCVEPELLKFLGLIK